MSRVWGSAPVKESNLIILLALADFANDNGICWPSLPALAKKARIGRRQAQRNVWKLQEMGLLAIDIGTGPRGANTYKVLWGVSHDTLVTQAPMSSGAGGVSPRSKGGGLDDYQTVIEPSLEPSGGSVSAEKDEETEKLEARMGIGGDA